MAFSGSIFRISFDSSSVLRSIGKCTEGHLFLGRRPQLVFDAVARQQLLDLWLQRGRIFCLHRQREQLLRLRLERLDDPQHEHDEARREDREHPQPDAGRQPDGERRQHHAGVLGVRDLRAVAHQPGRADDAERARQARADHEHHDGADDRQDDLRLDDRRLPRRRAAAARPQREDACEAHRTGRAHERVEKVLDLRVRVSGRIREHVAVLRFFLGVVGRA